MRFIIYLAFFLLLAGESLRCSAAPIQSPGIVGRWRVEFSFSQDDKHDLQFDAEASGKGKFLLLDARSNLLPPAEPTSAEWSQPASDQINFSGAVEFPIGNVGRDPGRLVFKGAFDSPTSIAGEVSFFRQVDGSDDRDAAPAKTGRFTARRVEAPGGPVVQSISVNFGKKVRRGRETTIEWQIQSQLPIAAQSLSLSLDGGETFVLLMAAIDAEVRSVKWTVPETLPKTKKARMMVAVADSSDNHAQAVSDNFRIR